MAVAGRSSFLARHATTMTPKSHHDDLTLEFDQCRFAAAVEVLEGHFQTGSPMRGLATSCGAVPNHEARTTARTRDAKHDSDRRPVGSDHRDRVSAGKFDPRTTRSNNDFMS